MSLDTAAYLTGLWATISLTLWLLAIKLWPPKPTKRA